MWGPWNTILSIQPAIAMEWTQAKETPQWSPPDSPPRAGSKGHQDLSSFTALQKVYSHWQLLACHSGMILGRSGGHLSPWTALGADAFLVPSSLRSLGPGGLLQALTVISSAVGRPGHPWGSSWWGITCLPSSYWGLWVPYQQDRQEGHHAFGADTCNMHRSIRLRPIFWKSIVGLGGSSPQLKGRDVMLNLARELRSAPPGPHFAPVMRQLLPWPLGKTTLRLGEMSLWSLFFLEPLLAGHLILGWEHCPLALYPNTPPASRSSNLSLSCLCPALWSGWRGCLERCSSCLRWLWGSPQRPEAQVAGRMAIPIAVPHVLSITGPLTLAAACFLAREWRTSVELGGCLFSAPGESKG